MDKRDTILIVDDMEVARAILSELFSDEYNIIEAQDGRVALSVLERMGDRIALILTDIVMPNLDGFGLLREMRGRNLLEEIPVIVTTSLDEPEHEVRAFELGAVDTVIKPFSPSVVRKRVGNILEQYGSRSQLEQLLLRQTNQLQESSALLVDTLSSIIEHRNTESASHVQSIKLYTRILLEAVSAQYPEYNLPYSAIDSITMASALHDIGKITISDTILNKPGKLVPEEFENIKQHTINGSEIIAQMLNIEEQEYLQYAYDICRYHHERWDGRGYPEGLRGDAIPLCAQVVGLADVYDALTSERVYKAAFSHDAAVEMILDGQCGMFSPKLIRCFTDVLPKFKAAVSESMPDELDDTVPGGIGDASPRRTYFDLYYSRLITAFKCLNATVVELDFNLNEFEVVYNNDNDFSTISTEGDSTRVAKDFIKEYFHPDDVDLATYQYDSCTEKLLANELFRSEHEYRILSDNADQYSWFSVSMVHVDMHSPTEHRAFILFRRIGDRETLSARIADDTRRMSLLRSNLRQPLTERAIPDKPFTESELVENGKAYLRAFHETVWEFDHRANVVRLYDEENEVNPHYTSDGDTVYNYLIKHVHPDDAKIVIEHIAHMREETAQPEITYRKYDPSGEYSWYRDTVAAVRDTNGTLIKYFGVTQNLDRIKSDAFHASLRDHRDTLTGLLDIEAMVDMASDAVRRSPKNARHALMLIDVDYFEQINASYGHIVGDSVLKSIADKLGLLFSGGDYVARVGGDEFAVFIRNAVSVSHVESMAQRLLTIFKQMPVVDSLNVSTSIGIALYPSDGITYEALLKNASAALRAAKFGGRGCWQRYSELSEKEVIRAAGQKDISRIDSERNYRQSFSSALVSIFNETDDEVAILNGLFDYVARKYMYNNVFAVDMRGDVKVNAQWSDIGESMSHICDPQVVAAMCALYDAHNNDNGMVIVPDTEELPEEFAREFRRAQIRGVLFTYLENSIAPTGFLGFVSRDEPHSFSEDEALICSVLAKISAMVYFKKGSAGILKRLRGLTGALLGKLNECNYVIDEAFEIMLVSENMRVKVLNGTTASLEGRKCYRVMAGRQRPCDHCPVLQLDKSGEPKRADIECQACGETVNIQASAIQGDGDVESMFLLTVDK